MSSTRFTSEFLAVNRPASLLLRLLVLVDGDAGVDSRHQRTDILPSQLPTAARASTSSLAWTRGSIEYKASTRGALNDLRPQNLDDMKPRDRPKCHKACNGNHHSEAAMAAMAATVTTCTIHNLHALSQLPHKHPIVAQNRRRTLLGLTLPRWQATTRRDLKLKLSTTTSTILEASLSTSTIFVPIEFSASLRVDRSIILQENQTHNRIRRLIASLDPPLYIPQLGLAEEHKGVRRSRDREKDGHEDKEVSDDLYSCDPEDTNPARLFIDLSILPENTEIEILDPEKPNSHGTLVLLIGHIEKLANRCVAPVSLELLWDLVETPWAFNNYDDHNLLWKHATGNGGGPLIPLDPKWFSGEDEIVFPVSRHEPGSQAARSEPTDPVEPTEPTVRNLDDIPANDDLYG
ncbi:hypothetical protein P154DRAFT_540983 [Amniculicola lignicola CBS 123094]|uniref:Uncharacterized protein n=1 Tax=Amniculicola lignicola CBS 123094 TaxID=1392246 RepID=A0A6A5VUP9_9PLEO|nr:hypothetical protein P154DRAFT_540983 [Amniculicola lignicola CBS 123094]